MHVDELRRRLTQRSAPAFSVYADDDAQRFDDNSAKAAVLVPIIGHPGGLTVLFTQRTTHLKAHSGQISFPGGRVEPHDPTPEFTALRETHEEIGLAQERVEILARMPEYLTRTGFRVTPVVGLVAPPLDLSPDPGEVAEVFEVPLDYLLEPMHYKREERELLGRMRGYYVIQFEERRIWGVTAGMLVNFCCLISGARPAG
jgi:8-oxo-dGTP pyrophosphatase MutT (NUDIX family)